MGERRTGLSQLTKTSTPRPERPPTERHSLRALLVVLLSVAGAVVVIAGVALGSYLVLYGESIPFGMRVLDMDVGGMQPARARSLLSDHLDAYLGTPIVLQYEDREWNVLPGELGAGFNADEPVARAFDLGQEGGLIERVGRQISYLQKELRLDLAVVFNDTAFQSGVVRLVNDIERAPKDASIRLEGAEVAMSPSQPGYQVDRAALRARLEESFSTLSATPLDVPVQEIPPKVKEEDLAQARKQIEDLLATPITVRHGDEKWTLDRAVLSGMVTLQQSTDSSGVINVQVLASPDKAEAWARGVAKEVDREVQDTRVVLTGGKATITNPGQPGVSVETAKFGGALSNALAKGDNLIDLPVVVSQPAGSNDLLRLGIKEKIAEASTSYAGTLPDRIHNVRLGAERINGKLVPPGGVFSMSETLGPITAQAGYKLGFAIVGQNTVLDMGGGLSQLTTTVFKAAFEAGFPIIERTTHSYRIRRYEPILGIEATIYPPYVDFKFRNDTSSYILVDARIDAGNVYVVIHGTKPNREVSVEGPIVENIVPTDREVLRHETPLLPKGTEVTSEVAEDGVDVTVYRIITVDGKEVRRERFFARFRPSHNVILVGTKE